jgi:hypothetical protein
MAQVTGQITGASFYAAVSTDGSSYTDVSGAATLVEPKATQRKHGEAYTGGSEDYPAKAYGKLEAQEWELTVIYTKAANEPYDLLRDALVANTRLNLRYCPEGNTQNNERFTLSGTAVRVVELDFPKAEGSEENPVVCKAVFAGPTVTQDVVP